MALRRALQWALTVAAIIAGTECAPAPSIAADFYKGKTITIVVGTPAGGGFDAYARLLARYLGKHIAGEPSIIVSNMPGADSNIAAAYVARLAAKDGTFIAAPNAPQPLFPILGNAADLTYDPSRMNYLGSAMSDDFLCIVRADAPATNFADMLKTQDIMGGTAENGITGMMPILLDNVLGAKFKVVLGYPGSREITVAMQRGEIHGLCGMNWTSLTSQYPILLDSDKFKIAAQENAIGIPELNDKNVPLTVSFAQNDEQRRILEILYAQEIFARPYFVAAEVPADRLAILRRAFLESWRDPDLLADAAKMHLVVGPISGADVQSLLQRIYANPPALLQKVKAAVKLK